MRYLIILLAFLSGAVCAQESTFEREFAKFDKDFERLNHWKAETPASKKIKKPADAQPANTDKAEVQRLDATEPVAATPAPDVPTKDPNAKVEPLTQSDLIGHQIKDPVVRKKVQDLYKRPDVVVQQYVLPTN
jgi:hypothetical protein